MTREEFKYSYQTHARAVRNYLYYRSGSTAVADDITQETFVRVWEKQFEYDAEKTKSLLYKIANQLFLDRVRKEKTEAAYTEELVFKLKHNSEGDGEKEAMLRKCERALAGLSENERTVFLMSRKDGMKYGDIAECLEISVKAVEKRMGLALKKLKDNQSWNVTTSI
ncbi:RNA polymerase sigma-70 factor (plasmid) [Fulvitalea axinellae]|uniref:RNA polymerase sigma-70 factor n=1 Tax=Fulvitalea axinellae TaxID=1182444 RepID=A0AAU9CWK2_9BACT|nr:RNA polymerase sigma-70 factor [Fulvitalea axinellae]